MQRKDIKDILYRVNSGTATPEEEQIVQYWLHYFQRKDLKSLSEEELSKESEAIYNSLMSGGNSKPVVRVRSLWPRIAAAASIILALSIGGYIYFRSHTSQQTAQNKPVKNDLDPGKNSATLTLSSGRKIVLSDAIMGELAKEAGVSITKTANGQVVYEIKDQASGSAQENKINTLTTQRGEQYQVILPDGSHVWLNAASSISYPASFASAKERKVTLTGEAYFEVVHNRTQPFRVVTNRQVVEDIGTHFNINSYADEPATLTTLLEGAVKINSNTLLRPGEQARLSAAGNIRVKTVDVDEAVAWKNGVFMLSNEPLESIMRKVGRWYNTDVTFTNEQLKQMTFSGTISRMDKVSKVLRRLELTNEVTFKIENNRILVGAKHP